jgi:hypothetical protein
MRSIPRVFTVRRVHHGLRFSVLACEKTSTVEVTRIVPEDYLFETANKRKAHSRFTTEGLALSRSL